MNKLNFMSDLSHKKAQRFIEKIGGKVIKCKKSGLIGCDAPLRKVVFKIDKDIEEVRKLVRNKNFNTFNPPSITEVYLKK